MTAQRLDGQALGLTARALTNLAHDFPPEAIKIIHINHRSLSVKLVNDLFESHGYWLRQVVVDYRDGVRQLQADVERDVLRVLDEAATASPTSSIVFLEDGAHGTLACARHGRNDVSLAVEQTMRGRRLSARLEANHRLAHPVVSIARTRVKTELEAPALAVRICDELSSYMTMAGSALIGASIRLVGYGVMGRSVAWRCRDNYACNVEVVERRKSVRAMALSEGFNVVDGETWPSATPLLIIGATGTDIWRAGLDLDVFPSEVYLCSISSGDIEFRSMVAYLKSAAARQVRQPYGTTYQMKGHQRIAVLGEGRPINFYRPEGVSLPIMFGDLIFSTMIRALHVGLTQASSAQQAVYELSDEVCQEQIDLWLRNYTKGSSFTWPPLKGHAVAAFDASRLTTFGVGGVSV